MDIKKAADDDQFLDLLVAYETEIASGNTSLDGLQEKVSNAPREVVQVLEGAKDCLLLLERVWPHETPFEEALPEAIGRFEIQCELGRGGFGIVYLASDPRLGRTVALKVQRPEAILSAPLRQRFLREARAAARLRHANIATVYEVSQEGLQCWIASEYCDGNSLAGWLQGRSAKVSPRSAAEFMAALADALGYSHQSGVLHRDLKPSNVLLQRLDTPSSAANDDLSAFTPKLIDFGLAKLAEHQLLETRSGALLGTPAYMAPEQAGGQTRQIGAATDIYGLGAILYELLAGCPVFRGSSDADTLRQVVADEPARPRQIRSDLPRDLEAICLKCLEKQPQKRYATCAALATDLRRFLAGEPTLVRPQTRTQRLFNWARKRPALACLASISAVASLALIALSLAYVAHLRTARETAEALRAEAEARADRIGRYAYDIQMRRAYEFLEKGAIGRIQTLLDEFKPGSRLAHLRGFEWYHLNQPVPPETHTLRADRGKAFAVAFSRNGRELATGGEEGLIRLWDPHNGQQLATIAEHQSCVNVLDYSPDGEILASGSCDGTIKLHHATTHELLATLESECEEVYSLAFSPDGRLLAAGGRGAAALIWDLATRKVIKRFNTEHGKLHWIVWRDASTLVMALSTCAAVWNIDTDERHSRPGYTLAAAVSPVDREIILIGPNGLVDAWSADLSTQILMHGWEPQNRDGFPTGVIEFSPDGQWLAVANGDCLVVWHRQPAGYRRAFQGHVQRIQRLAFSPTSDLLASASDDGTCKVWGLLEDQSLTVSTGPEFPRSDGDLANNLAISPDCRYLAVRDAKDRVSVTDVRGKYREAARIAVPADSTTAISFRPGQSPTLLNVAQDDGRVLTWNVTENHLAGDWSPVIPATGSLGDPGDSPRYFTILPNGRHLLAIDTQSVTMFDIHARIRQRTFRSDRLWEVGIAFSEDLKTLGVRTGGQPAYLIDMATGRERRPSSVTAIANDAKFFATCNGKNAWVFEPDSSTPVCTLEHSGEVYQLAFSPDLRTLATVTTDGRVYLWSLLSGEPITQFDMRSGRIHKLQFSSDSRKLAAINLDYKHGITEAITSNIRVFVWEGSSGP